MNQAECGVEKVLRTEGNKLFVKWKGYSMAGLTKEI